MKTINKIILGMALLGTLPMMTACHDDNDTPVEPVAPVEDPHFEFVSELPDPPTFIFETGGNKASTIAFNTNQNWRVDLVGGEDGTENYDWLTLFDREGKGSDQTQRVWIAAGPNTSYDARRAEFTLTVGEGDDATVKTFWVYQYQKDAILATDPKAFLNLSNDEQELPLEFQYNIEEYDISVSDKSWMTVSDKPTTRAMVSATKYVTIAANNTFNVRTGTITIKDKNNSNTSVQVPVAQYGLAKPVIAVSNAADFSGLSSAAANIDLQLITENVVSVCNQLTVDIPATAKDWISFQANADSTGYILKVKENEAGARSAKVAVAAKADHSVKYEFTVKQSSADGVSVAISNKNAFENNFDKKGGTFSLKYQSEVENWDWAVEDVDGNPITWVQVANKKMPGQILFTFDANPTLKTRTAVLKVFPVGNEAKADKVSMVQAAGTQVVLNGSLQNTLNQLVADGIYKTVEDITSLELKGTLANADFALLQKMLKGNGYKLNTIDLSEVTNNQMSSNQFNGCTQLKSIVFPKALRKMGEKICANCTNLTSAKFPEGPTFIGNHMFQNCSNLGEVWIPSTVQYLYGMIFEKCTRMKKIHLQTLPLQFREVARSETQPLVASDGIFDEATRRLMGSQLTLYVPTDYEKYYRNPVPQHVVNMHLAEYLSKLTADSDEWNKFVSPFEWKPGKAYSLKVDFSWGFSAIVAEDAWAEE